jgi:lysozyme family protein
VSDFDRAVVVVLKHEGGWVSNPADPGGETNFGISSLFIVNEKLTAEDLGIDPATFLKPGYLKPMTVDTAKALYRRCFWDRFEYGNIADQLAATKVFDSAVNCGPVRSHMFAQRASTRIGHPATPDGILGPMTLAAINACAPQPFVAAFADEMRQYYETLVANRPALAEFESNWLKRARWGLDNPAV